MTTTQNPITHPRLTLRKGEKLRHRTLVEGLFREGKTLYEYPLRLTWRIISKDELRNSFRDKIPDKIDTLQMLITVPKKKRRHAVDRVLIRRRIREAYRLNRTELKKCVESAGEIGGLHLAFIYIHTENMDYSLIEKKMKRLLAKVRCALTNEKSDSLNNEKDERIE